MPFTFYVASLSPKLKYCKADTNVTFQTRNLTSSSVALMDHETTIIMDSPNIFGDRPKSRCPHCNFYPKHGENKVCEACESQMGKDEIEAFLGGEERNWCVYHLNREGFLPSRAALEDTMRARLIQEQRCVRLCCALRRVSRDVALQRRSHRGCDQKDL